MSEGKPIVNALRPWSYAWLFDDLVPLAREAGYALAIHGSMATDADIIAAPWAENAVSADELAARIDERCRSYFHGDEHALCHWFDMTNTLKPHGRMAYTIRLASDLYVDLSIMPRLEEAAE